MDYKQAYENLRGELAQWNCKNFDLDKDKNTMGYAMIYAESFLAAVDAKFKL